ncbi:hypothetical protein C8F01DRAFT_1145525 [Mycena amicta]|nr:hypothetical protein C8F01DRAFT_1145525 [Mycena amicta]
MHRCLRIPEMVDLILSHFDIFYIDKVTTAHVYALARTCSIFYFPALDILWKEQRTLLNLLKCVSDDAWVPDEALGLRFVRPLERRDIDRVLFYAPRIERLRISYDKANCCQAVKTIFAHLDLVGVHRLFPNLALLDGGDENWDAETLSRFFGPKLTTLSLPTLEKDVEVLELLHRTPLTSLSVCGAWVNDGSASFASRIIELVCSLSCLKYLHVGSLDAQALKHIGVLPSLQRLHFHLSADVNIVIDDTNPAPFEHLRSLTFHATAHTASNFLGSVALNCLNELELHLAGDTAPTDLEIRAVFAALREHVNQETLTYLCVPSWGQLITPPHTSPNFPTFVLSATTLDALAPFTQLERLDIPAPAGTNFTDADVAAFANAHPHLETLAIVTPSHVEWPEENWLRPLTTLQALVSLVDLCPFLVEIRLAVDVARGGVPTIDMNPQSQLESLDVIYSPIRADQVDLVAQFLAALAPDMTDLTTSEDDEGSAQGTFEDREAQARVSLAQYRRTRRRGVHAESAVNGDAAQVIDGGDTAEDEQDDTDDSDGDEDDLTAGSAFDIAMFMGLQEWNYCWIRAHREALRISKAWLTQVEPSADEDSAQDEQLA